MNAVSAVFICVAGIIYAVCVRYKTAKKIRFFESFYKFVYLFGVYSVSTAREIGEVVSDILNNDGFSVLSFAKEACLASSRGENLDTAWNEAVQRDCSALNAREKALVGRFVSVVGVGDIYTQEKTMKIYLEEIETNIKQLSDYEKKDMRVRCAVAIFICCAGALVVI